MFRPQSCLKILATSFLLSLCFTSIFISIFLHNIKKHPNVFKSLQATSVQLPFNSTTTNSRPFSYHINDTLAKKLNDVWADIIAHDHRPADAMYNVNVTISDRMSLDRALNKTRPDACDSVVYDESSLPTICCIIPFYNEPLSLLLRTLHSILNRTPERLLTEVILVDDNSSYDDLKVPLETYINYLPKVHLLRNAERKGLIRTRLKGLKKCTAQVVHFQDAHTEVNEGWAQPALYHLKRHPNHLVQPGIDPIMPHSLEYQNGIGDDSRPPICTFSWDLRYVWLAASDRVLSMRKSLADPVQTATIVGCSIIVNRKNFIELGGFDELMNTWGGENLEISFRYWQCGGAVITHPCSRIGHVFKSIPYHFENEKGEEQLPEQVVIPNLARVAEVWLGSYKRYFYATTWIWPANRFNISEQFLAEVATRRQRTYEQFGCKSFDWYVKKVTPEIRVPSPNAVWYGEVINPFSDSCLVVLSCGHVSVTQGCSWFKVQPNLQFYIAADGTFHIAELGHICLTFEQESGLLVTMSCADRRVLSVRFSIDSPDLIGHLTMQTSRPNRQLCATPVTYHGQGHFHYNDLMVAMIDCNSKDTRQNWQFIYKFDYNIIPST